jgi:hypothetical protein
MRSARVDRFVVWLVAGVPALVLGTGLLLAHRRPLTLAAYAVLAVGFGVVAVFDPASAAVVGTVIALLYASGRGRDEEAPPRHEPGVPRVVERPERAD